MKKLFLRLLFVPLVILSFLITGGDAFANESGSEVNLYFFWQYGCPHCKVEAEFLEKLADEDPYLNIQSYEISENVKNASFLRLVGETVGAGTGGVPFTVVGSKGLVGFLDGDTTGKLIIAYIEDVRSGNDTDVVLPLLVDHSKSEEETGLEYSPSTSKQDRNDVVPGTLKLPLFGEVTTKDLSLPALTVVIAFLDGFNPCAMWVLIFLISLLLGMKDRRRMWILGSTFIAASTFVYFLFMVAWLNLFLFLGFVFAVRVIIGFFAAGIGIYNVREFFRNKEGGCKVTKAENRRKILEKLKSISQRQELWLALGGIILLAFAVNLIEAVCSAGLPAIFTQILTLSDLSTWEYYLYILLYLAVFMIDDLFVFVTAMITLKAMGIESKYARYSHLIGGIVMLAIGIIMLFRPELLMFG